MKSGIALVDLGNIAGRLGKNAGAVDDLCVALQIGQKHVDEDFENVVFRINSFLGELEAGLDG